jgi:pullulanase
VKSDLKGKYYLFSVYNNAQPDNTPGIFAKAVGVNGKRGAIVDLRDTDPEGWADDVRPTLNNQCDLVIYEMHHRDFSVDLSSGLKHKGKYLALTEPKAIEHLQRLGVNAVHILPSFDYASVDESKPDVPQYNWGYDPLNYNVPEGSYSTDAATPTTRIREFKQMVQALHRAGIRVILDVVYNHTFDINGSNFQKTYPDYFYRKTAEGKYSDGSGCGNETASEKPLMREFMKESVEYWIKEYHIDGFRFDLMGVHDIETMNEIRAMVDQIDPSIYIYGEGWSAGSCAYPQEKLAMKANTKQLNGIGAFCDDMRDALRGPFSDDHKGGFLIGEPDQEESIKFGIVGAIAHPQIDMTKVNYSREAWTNEPSQMVAYVSCHDDMCLTDRLRATVPYITDDELIRLDLLAQTAVLTSQGVPFILSGEEMLRDKKSVHNSYRSPDSINRLDWNNLKRYPQVFDYYAGLIALRKAHPAFRMGKAEEVRKHLEFVDAPKGVVAFRLKDNAGGDAWRNIYVVLNSQKTPQNVKVAEGSYTTVVANGKVNADGLGLISGTTLTVAPQSALIVHD